jgi:hypothetical protein
VGGGRTRQSRHPAVGADRFLGSDLANAWDCGRTQTHPIAFLSAVSA